MNLADPAFAAANDPDEAACQANLSTFLQACARAKQTNIARKLSMSDQSFSDWKNTEAHDVIRRLTACGLRLVPLDHLTYDPDEIEALLTLAKRAISGIPNARTLGREL